MLAHQFSHYYYSRRWKWPVHQCIITSIRSICRPRSWQVSDRHRNDQCIQCIILATNSIELACSFTETLSPVQLHLLDVRKGRSLFDHQAYTNYFSILKRTGVVLSDVLCDLMIHRICNQRKQVWYYLDHPTSWYFRLLIFCVCVQAIVYSWCSVEDERVWVCCC